MQRLWFVFMALAAMLAASAASAAPQQVRAVYQATRNGQPFATVTETFQQQDGRYRLESVTEGIGVYALFGKRRQLSEGEVTAQGLRPLHFEQHLDGSGKKPVMADFDWAAGTLTMKSKGQPSSAALEEGTQDQLSYAYQFMFRPPQGDEFSLPVTSGKKLRTYRFRIVDKGLGMDTPAGTFSAMRLANGAADGEENKELWLGEDRHHIVLRSSMKDENGARIEQTLSSLHVE